MKSGYWESLRPFEKRVVVAVAALFFVVLNFLFVFPYFSEWKKVDERMFQARRKLRMFEDEVSKTNVYWLKVREMEKAGLEVPPEDQVRHFANTIDVAAGRSGVNMLSGGRTTISTNQFFIDLSRSIGAQSPESPLVDFLYNLGSGSSLIRVRELNLRPDPARQQIVANVTLVASYQKTVAKPAEPARTASGAVARSAANAALGMPQSATPKKK